MQHGPCPDQWVQLSSARSCDTTLLLLQAFNPENTPGRLAIIVRMGAQKLRGKLPALVQAVEHAGHTVTWICDPMHGNTESCGSYKTRRCLLHTCFGCCLRCTLSEVSALLPGSA